jgi:L-lactate dehydrogenase complex protein LldG
VDASRDEILGALAATRAAPDPIGGFTGEPVRFADPVAAFREALGAAGGSLAELPDRVALDRALAAADPDAVVLAGGPAVAESGAVWWVPRDEAERRAAFLAERVILVVPRDGLVDDLHAAYQRIDPAAAHYGCFVAGPSKTADIEQALVIGAHGPRALDVYLWGVSDSSRTDHDSITSA